jgi:hypothetical protein
MTYSVGTLWIIYASVLVGTWILLAIFLTNRYAISFFLATIFAAVAAFIGAAWLNPNQLTDNDKSWLTVLFMVAILLPVFALLYLCCWNGNVSSCRVKRTIQCDEETGICHLQKKTIYQGDGDITEIVYN